MNRAEPGAALGAPRQASGKEAKAVARSAVMSTSKLSKIENGRAAPSVVEVERIPLIPGLLQTPEYVRAVLSEQECDPTARLG
ncbi:MULTISPECIES: Scr1 family TA system antitoxin-like transcriptional regulator [unclassified Streptomyces]|uniref:helix-turn-helix domain-containing protein n=1 Tax=unclassified Streptomyces TaxID=2593676 RepID=UPI0038286B4E